MRAPLGLCSAACRVKDVHGSRSRIRHARPRSFEQPSYAKAAPELRKAESEFRLCSVLTPAVHISSAERTSAAAWRLSVSYGLKENKLIVVALVTVVVVLVVVVEAEAEEAVVALIRWPISWAINCVSRGLEEDCCSCQRGHVRSRRSDGETIPAITP